MKVLQISNYYKSHIGGIEQVIDSKTTNMCYIKNKKISNLIFTSITYINIYCGDLYEK